MGGRGGARCASTATMRARRRWCRIALWTTNETTQHRAARATPATDPIVFRLVAHRAAIGEKMTDSNGSERGFDGRDFAIVLLTLGGVGGYLWLDHKLTLERKVATDLSKDLALLLAGGASVSPPAASVTALPRPLALPAPAPAPRNASYAVRVPRLERAPRTYDDVFARRGRGLPVPYLRALALHESDMRARLADGPAWGLLQVIEVVREDHNRLCASARVDPSRSPGAGRSDAAPEPRRPRAARATPTGRRSCPSPARR
jgi:hypothetical protein